ncbi:MAG: hypothetical protein CTY34_10450 [Methylobacter sp.]|nr:MAG: hypothetical protein CTY34_10450 [Methylobacter sp.]PPD03109.1 MAG: hypothetical protein CTY29_10765 [Methylobacter sp.]PPD22320.1 MAG: hypothetical protein CTY24_06595 [Methylobacter sp.]PPD36563.1 MAG: hypothetical protein CTY18_04120 [Methylomonas sp.]
MIIKKFISVTLITIVWLAVIYTESSQPPPKIFGVIPGLDKVAHFVVYGILGAMILTLLIHVNRIFKIPYFQLTLFLVVLAGIFDEFHQSFVPTRNTDGWDLFADFCGGLFTIFIIERLLRRRKACHV